MEITGEMLKNAFKKNPAKCSHAFAELLREFGYAVHDDYIQNITQRLINGEKINNNAPAMFINDWLTNGMEE